MPDIVRNGFVSAYGHFYTQKGRVQAYESSRLKEMFLPQLTKDGNRLLNDYRDSDFVEGQLQHYGVKYDESELYGRGTNLMKKMLREGKLDKIPQHLITLKGEMHTEWLMSLSEKDLSGHPDWIMERYFLGPSGEPDPHKTTKAIGIPYRRDSNHSADQLRKRVEKVDGLHHGTSWGSTQTIYLGWSKEIVEAAVKSHAEKEAREQKAEEEAREAGRAARHQRYLDGNAPGSISKCPAGTYMIDCPEIEGNWSDMAKNMTMEIRRTPNPRIYHAIFHFGVVEGMMILSTDEKGLWRYCDDSGRGYCDDGDDGDGQSDDDNQGDDEDVDMEDQEIEEDEGEDEENEDLDSNVEDPDQDDKGSDKDGSEEEEDNEDDEKADQDEDPVTGSKRKHYAGMVTSAPRKNWVKIPRLANEPKEWFACLKSRDCGTGQINYQATKGTITFDNEAFSSFSGVISLPGIGQKVSFTARKVTSLTRQSWDSWEDYSEAAYERERVNRWR